LRSDTDSVQLHWVNENIAAFGGDASQVTIWVLSCSTIRRTDTNITQGESAGASSVGFQLVAYGGRNDSIITRAIMESGNSVPYSRMPSPPLPLKPFLPPLANQSSPSTPRLRLLPTQIRRHRQRNQLHPSHRHARLSAPRPLLRHQRSDQHHERHDVVPDCGW